YIRGPREIEFFTSGGKYAGLASLVQRLFQMRPEKPAAAGEENPPASQIQHQARSPMPTRTASRPPLKVRCAASRSASTISRTNSGNVTDGSQPSRRRAFVKSAWSGSTSAGL